jgi:hypothetical protein
MIVLFGEVIRWRANKQNTVTISTTEAELLLLSQGAKEGQYIKYLLNKLTISLDDQQIQIHYDNCQTIWLVSKEIACLQTKLQHINIHNHWLHQEVRDGKIIIKYISIKKIIINGLTKVLTKTEFNKFLSQINLINIADKIAE